MANNMKTVKEVKPTVKEYSSVRDYFDDVITKTYDILKTGGLGEVMLSQSKIKYRFENPLFNVKIDNYDQASNAGRRANIGYSVHTHMTIDTPTAYVNVTVKKQKPWATQKPNAELTVERKNIPVLSDAGTELGVWNEIESALKTGLKQYESAKVAFK